jgi:hypothetical protein
MRYLIVTILILVILGAVGMVVLKKSSVVPATHAVGQTILHGSYVSADPGLGYFINFDRYPGVAEVRAPCVYQNVQYSSYTVYGNKLHLGLFAVDLTLMPDGTIQCPPGFGPPPSGVILKRRNQ